MPSATTVIQIAAALTVLLPACRYGFEFADPADARTDNNPAGDARPDDASVVADDFCPPVPELVGCFTFEGELDDRSIHGNHATGAGTIGYSDGMAGLALTTDASTEVTIPDHPSLRYPPDQLTMEAWVWLDEPPPTGGGRVGVVDQDGGPSIFIYDGGDVRCFTDQRYPTGPGYIQTGAWTHLACTYLSGTTTIYVDGQPIVTQPGGGDVTAGTIGVSIAGDSPSGAPLVGAIDSLRIWHIARSADEICAAAGPRCP